MTCGFCMQPLEVIERIAIDDDPSKIIRSFNTVGFCRKCEVEYVYTETFKIEPVFLSEKLLRATRADCYLDHMPDFGNECPSCKYQNICDFRSEYGGESL